MVRSWIRQALRASGVAILVPAAVAAAIALSVLGGGHNVGSLGEVLRGPAVPPAEAAGLRGRTPQSGPGLKERTPQSGTVPNRHPAAAPRRPPARHPMAPVMQPPAPAPAAPAPAQSARPQPSPAPPPPAPKPHPIHDTGTAVAETLRPLPLAGPAAADAVEAVVSLVDPA